MCESQFLPCFPLSSSSLLKSLFSSLNLLPNHLSLFMVYLPPKTFTLLTLQGFLIHLWIVKLSFSILSIESRTSYSILSPGYAFTLWYESHWSCSSVFLVLLLWTHLNGMLLSIQVICVLWLALVHQV